MGRKKRSTADDLSAALLFAASLDGESSERVAYDPVDAMGRQKSSGAKKKANAHFPPIAKQGTEKNERIETAQMAGKATAEPSAKKTLPDVAEPADDDGGNQASDALPHYPPRRRNVPWPHGEHVFIKRAIDGPDSVIVFGDVTNPTCVGRWEMYVARNLLVLPAWCVTAEIPPSVWVRFDAEEDVQGFPAPRECFELTGALWADIKAKVTAAEAMVRDGAAGAPTREQLAMMTARFWRVWEAAVLVGLEV